LFRHVLDNSRKDSAKKNDDQVHPVHKGWMQYFSTLGVDYLTVVLPIILVFTVSNPSLYFGCA
jgi:phosphatidylinositol glycan class W